MKNLLENNWKRVLFAIIILLICSLNRPASSAEYKPGQYAIIVKDQAEFKDENKVTAKGSVGQVVEVGQLNGEWVWVLLSRGWIHQNNILPPETVINEKTKKIQEKATAQDYHLRGIAYHLTEKYEDAINDFTSALKEQPDNFAILVNRGRTYALMKKNEQAIKDFSDAIKLNDKNAVLYHNRGVIYTNEGKYELALADLNKAIALDPKYAEAFNSRGNLHKAQDNAELALKDFSHAIELRPYLITAYENRGLIKAEQSEYDLAISDFEQALKLNSNSLVALNNLAWILATCPDKKTRNGKRAVELAQKGCELTEFKDWNRLDTLAAAQAEAGDFDKAVESIQKAIDIAPENVKESLQKSKEQYQAKKPTRS